MWNRLRLRRRRFFALGEILAGGLILGGVWFWWQNREPRNVELAALGMRGGVLCVHGESRPYDGLLVENYPTGGRKLAIEMRGGLAHGASLGWYENGQKEVEETFVRGVSHGQRTRWYADGRLRSRTSIAHGRLDGLYEEWHPNGGKALEITYGDGKPQGVARAWSDTGVAKSPRLYRDGSAAVANTIR